MSLTTTDVLKAYLPPFVREDPVMAAFFDAVGPELDDAIDRGLSIPAQAWPHLVTWGMARLEAVYGLPVSEGAPLEKRRSALLARMRGSGTSTVAQIAAIARSFAGGSVSLTEDPAAYTVTVEFIDELGVPPYLEALQDALRAAIPAHLLIEYILNWTTFGELDAAGVTWGDLSTAGTTWGELQTLDLEA